MKKFLILSISFLISSLSMLSLSLRAEGSPYYKQKLEDEKGIQTDSIDQVPLIKKGNVSRRRSRLNRNEEGKEKSSLSIRQQQFNERLSQKSDNAPWKRIIYRQVDLDSANNAVLYYPPRPSDTEQNLFTTLFKLLNKGELKAYEYTDGVEVFDPRTEIKFGEFLDRFGIYATKGKGDDASAYHVENADIPSDLVKAYYLKEEYYFDPIKSNTSKRVIALCPIFYDDLGTNEQLRFPLFWVKYDDIRPYIKAKKVMISDKNNAESLTLDGFFRLALYKGDIYKTLNLQGKTLAQYCPTPDSLRHERERIEAELQSFESSLWSRMARESISSEETVKADLDLQRGKTARARRAQEKSLLPKKVKAPKPPKASQKTSASGGRSARSRF